MEQIRLLDQHTINKIAAGEVVESPKSVVKELVENAIDAGATSIAVEIKEGGISYLRVTDNGCGIPKDQVQTAFLRHATNKMRQIEDLESVFTLGFRGEALASIAAVAQVEMLTRTKEEQTGTRVVIAAGEISVMEDAVCKEGTSITVKNLFFNVPARKKFLKKPSVEGGYVSDVMQKTALGHPEISFRYVNNDTVVLHTSGSDDPKTAVFYAYGKETANAMIEVSYAKGDYSVHGLIGKPELARANRGYENLFINGRFIKNKIVSDAVEDAYKTRMLVGRFPVFVLYLQVLPALVDVNVHPAKLEVRFKNDSEVYDFFYQAVSRALADQVLIPKVTLEKSTKAKEKITHEQQEFDFSESENEQEKVLDRTLPEVQSYYGGEGILEQRTVAASDLTPETKRFSVDDLLKKKEPSKDFLQQQAMPYRTDLQPDATEANFAKQQAEPETEQTSFTNKIQPDPAAEKKHTFFADYRIVGQVFGTYWLIEQKQKLYIIDQHAAHERVLYEKLMRDFQERTVISQRLLVPVMLNLTPLEFTVATENQTLLESFGFAMERYGQQLALTAVPFLLKEPSDTGFFRELLDRLSDQKIRHVYDTKILAVATMACKAAVKAHDRLDLQEATALIHQLLKLENPFTCPHGRPTIIEITQYELEKMFKRIQN